VRWGHPCGLRSARTTQQEGVEGEEMSQRVTQPARPAGRKGEGGGRELGL
jgi:hypothetical protein